MNDKQLGDVMSALLADLDRAILQAVENPLLFADSPLLEAIENRCACLTPGARQMRTSASLDLLAWDVRARSGRLKMLLDSASQFYTTCFSASQCQGLAYGMHGEWGALENPSHLRVDC